MVKEEALFYEKQLREEIESDRSEHGKKPLKDNGDEDGGSTGALKEEKQSTTDPDSGWFHKGKHKQVFAYSIETACDKNGWILGYTVNRGNLHDSRTFKELYDKRKETIERLFGTAKEHHGFRYTQQKGKARMGNEGRAYFRMPESQKISFPTGFQG